MNGSRDALDDAIDRVAASLTLVPEDTPGLPRRAWHAQPRERTFSVPRRIALAGTAAALVLIAVVWWTARPGPGAPVAVVALESRSLVASGYAEAPAPRPAGTGELSSPARRIASVASNLRVPANLEEPLPGADPSRALAALERPASLEIDTLDLGRDAAPPILIAPLVLDRLSVPPADVITPEELQP